MERFTTAHFAVEFNADFRIIKTSAPQNGEGVALSERETESGFKMLPFFGVET